MKLRDLGLVLLVMVIWGLNYPIGKIGVAAVPPMTMIALRFALVAAILLPFVKMPRGHWRAVALFSIVNGVLHYAPNFVGLKLVDSGIGAILNQLSVPFSAILAALFFGDRLGWRRALGMALAFLGVAVLVGEPRRETDLLGAFLMMAAAFTWAVSMALAKNLSAVHPLSLTAWMCAFAAPQLFLCSLLLEEQPIARALAAGWAGWGPILFMAVLVSLVSHTLWYSVVQRYPLNVSAPFGLLTPVFGVAFGALILGERLTLWMLAGAAIVLAGVAIITIRRPAQGAVGAGR
jgi:O-acetylserine/cysteine efflux transporter